MPKSDVVQPEIGDFKRRTCCKSLCFAERSEIVYGNNNQFLTACRLRKKKHEGPVQLEEMVGVEDELDADSQYVNAKKTCVMDIVGSSRYMKKWYCICNSKSSECGPA